jgi:hypothetical protein
MLWDDYVMVMVGAAVSVLCIWLAFSLVGRIDRN